MHRNERFSKDYHEKIKMLLDIIMPYLMTKYREMPVETHELNKSLAQFLKVYNITRLSHTVYIFITILILIIATHSDVSHSWTVASYFVSSILIWTTFHLATNVRYTISNLPSCKSSVLTSTTCHSTYR